MPQNRSLQIYRDDFSEKEFGLQNFDLAVQFENLF